MHARRTAERAGLEGILFTVGRTDDRHAAGRVTVSLDYSQFASAYGGGYGSRLRLVRYPACILTTPEKPGCRTPVPVQTRNDTQTKTLTAQITAEPDANAGEAARPTPTPSANSTPRGRAISDALTGAPSTTAAGTVLAAEAGTSGDKGDYSATSLSPSATFDVGLNSGDFNWSYPMRVPPVPGGMAPDVALSYSSGSVDGKTANTNGQSSWVGEGFELWPGYIERKYKSCKDDGAPKDEWGNSPGDQCWGYDNATVTWNGKGGELIKAADGTWRLKNDDGTKFEKLTAAEVDNGDNDNEYWKVTTPDGTRYYFGNHKGHGSPGTNSTWTVPVFGDDSGEPCHNSSGFKDSWCDQAWRWNLDYAVDRDGNAVVYYYNAEQNHYGRNLKPEDETDYIRGGTLERIEYGLREGQLTAKPAALVKFTTAERCLPDANFDCAEGEIDAKRIYWRDTPWDLHCDSDQKCEENHGAVVPTFWSRKRLTQITTQAIKSDGTYRNVDIWKITHQWGAADESVTLLPHYIQHSGVALSTAVELPPLRLEYQPYASRVDGTGDDLAPYLRHRLIAVTDEFGGKTLIDYAPTQCAPDSLPSPATNTRRCFPIYWAYGGSPDPKIDWFHKYVVASVTRQDLTGGAQMSVTTYDYPDGPDQQGAAWHYDDDDGLVPEKYKTWSQWRGYGKVTVKTGTQNSPESRTDHYFLRGMHGDRENAAGDQRSVYVPDGAQTGEQALLEDDDAWAGFEYRTDVYDGPAGRLMTKTVNAPRKQQTASRVRSWGTTRANLTGVLGSRTWTRLEPSDTWRQTKIRNLEFDDRTGLVVKSEDRGDESKTGDEQCATITYKPNTTDWLLNHPAQITSVGAACGADYDPKIQTISDIRTSYDGQAWGTPPTKGHPTHVARLTPDPDDPLTGTPSYKRVSATQYDDYGRVTKVTDALDNVTSTTYVESPIPSSTTQGLTTRITTTPPATGGYSHATTADLNAAWGVPWKSTDAGGKTTQIDYDALGRLTKVWRPDRSKTLGDAPSVEYTYQIEQGQIVAVGTRTATNSGGQTPYSYTLYDGLLRPRQTQTRGPNGGRVITDTFYNPRGLVYATYEAYYNNQAGPTPALFTLDTSTPIRRQIRYTHDGLGRVTRTALLGGPGDTSEIFAETTQYGGDWVKVTPPSGGVPTTTYTDARGQQAKVVRHNTGTVADSVVSYGYDARGNLTTITGPNGKQWEHTYDLLNREIKTVDPDAGTSTYGYDELDRPTWTVDARGEKTTTRYDALGRVLSTADGAGNTLTSYEYDSVRVGQLTAEKRHAKGPDGTTTLTYENRVDIYDPLNRPVRNTITIPTAETGLGGSYQYNTAYNPDGTLAGTSIPAAGGLPTEPLVYGYNDLQQPTTLHGMGSYVTGTAYSDATGQVLAQELTTGSTAMWIHNQYDEYTNRLTRNYVVRYNVNGFDRDAHYTYDDAGNITKIRDNANDGTDTQCFRYDGLRQLTKAWTPADSDCTTDPASATIGGPAPYRLEYEYDTAGNRTSESQYTAGSNGGTPSATRTYQYAGQSGLDPSVKGHMLGAVTQNATSPFSGPAAAERYTYHANGAVKTRTIGDAAQEFTYDSEGEIAKLKETRPGEPDAYTTFVYTPGGDRLIRRDPTGTTLYLPGMELRVPKNSTTATATRYYSHALGTIAMRTSAGVTFLAGDHQNTSQLAVKSTEIDQPTAIAVRRFTPFGQNRDTTGTWPAGHDKGFVGGTIDPVNQTGLKPLTHLGAREYDPNNGRFLSVDPLFNFDYPQSWNGYGYANNTPVVQSDPEGLDGPLRGNKDCYYNNKGCGGGGGGDGDDPPSNGGGGGGGCGFWCHAGNLGGGVFKSLAETIEIPRDFFINLSASMMKLGCTSSMCYNAVDNAVENSTLSKEIPTWGDPNSLEFKIGKFTADWGPVVLGGAGAVRAILKNVAKNGVKRTGRNLSKKAPPAKAPGNTNAGPAAPRPATARCSSFVPGTTVLMADGTHKQIEDIKVGDKVIATDPETGKTHTKEVLATITSKGRKELVEITVDTDGPHGDKTGLVIATDKHPFWVDGVIQRWIDAEDLRPGMWLRTSAGTHVQITAIKTRTAYQRVHNLSVNDLRTYYVVAGQTPILVHNIPTPIGQCPIGRPVYGIPAGSAGGSGAGQRIPREMLEDFNIGVQADPNLPTPVCSYCRTNPAQAVDHVYPRSKSGDLTDANVAPICRFCNSSKKDRPAPLNPPPAYTGAWPPLWWPLQMQRTVMTPRTVR